MVEDLGSASDDPHTLARQFGTNFRQSPRSSCVSGVFRPRAVDRGGLTPLAGPAITKNDSIAASSPTAAARPMDSDNVVAELVGKPKKHPEKQ